MVTRHPCPSPLNGSSLVIVSPGDDPFEMEMATACSHEEPEAEPETI
jgi:hypothetical protein